MGCGKSTLGRLVAAQTPLQFIDLDLYIENRYHASIANLFQQHGEEGFRRLESNILAEVADFENVIVACGGGTPCFHNNMDIINSRGVAVWLQAPVEILHSRLMKGKHKRPLIAHMDSQRLRAFIEEALAARQHHYARAPLRFDTAQLETRTQCHDTARRFIDQIITPLAQSSFHTDETPGS